MEGDRMGICKNGTHRQNDVDLGEEVGFSKT
jgi:hypothetical protein